MNNTAAKRPLVLLVEDELFIREDAAAIIRSAGFDVMEAANADEAIKILESNLNVAIVFTDVQMPGSMDGLKLAAAVRGRWPPIKIVATSGLVDIQAHHLPDGGKFLPKPYRPTDVVDILREVMAA